MKKFGKILLWIFGVIGILTVLLIIIALKSFPKEKKVDIKPGTYLELSLTGYHHDYNEYKNIFFLKEDASIGDLCRKIESAKDDPNIEGIILKPEFYRCGWALTEGLRNKLQEFKNSEKKIYSIIDIATDKGYYLASIADSIFLNPSTSAGLALFGIGMELSYYKGLLDKIGIEFTVLHQGKYKGTGEMFSRKTISKPMRQSLTSLLENVYDDYVENTAASRDISLENYKDLMENRDEFIISNQQALDYGLVDEIIYEKDFFNEILPENHIVSMDEYPEKISVISNKIAVIYAQGFIVMSDRQEFPSRNYRSITEKKIAKELDRIEKMKTVKGVVLRVNSGGGSALVSENILHRIKEFKRKKKSLYVSMGNVAASGGYMVSCAADMIFAEPNTITGSIGVVAMLPNWQKLREKADINTYQIKRGKFAGYLSPNFSPSQTDLLPIKQKMEDIYVSFKKMVAENRDLTMEEVEKVAQGRIWSGDDAQKNGLIDQIGGLDRAIEKAAFLANIHQYSLLILPQKKGLIDLILERKNGFNIKTIFSTTSEIFALHRAGLFYDNFMPAGKIMENRNLVESFLEEPVQLILPQNIELD